LGRCCRASRWPGWHPTVRLARRLDQPQPHLLKRLLVDHNVGRGVGNGRLGVDLRLTLQLQGGFEAALLLRQLADAHVQVDVVPVGDIVRGHRPALAGVKHIDDVVLQVDDLDDVVGVTFRNGQGGAFADINDRAGIDHILVLADDLLRLDPADVVLVRPLVDGSLGQAALHVEITFRHLVGNLPDAEVGTRGVF
jgi:hypothetical protein